MHPELRIVAWLAWFEMRPRSFGRSSLTTCHHLPAISQLRIASLEMEPTGSMHFVLVLI